jgi:hypothetical protein
LFMSTLGELPLIRMDGRLWLSASLLAFCTCVNLPAWSEAAGAVQVYRLERSHSTRDQVRSRALPYAQVATLPYAACVGEPRLAEAHMPVAARSPHVPIQPGASPRLTAAP